MQTLRIIVMAIRGDRVPGRSRAGTGATGICRKFGTIMPHPKSPRTPCASQDGACPRAMSEASPVWPLRKENPGAIRVDAGGKSGRGGGKPPPRSEVLLVSFGVLGREGTAQCESCPDTGSECSGDGGRMDVRIPVTPESSSPVGGARRTAKRGCLFPRRWINISGTVVHRVVDATNHQGTVHQRHLPVAEGIAILVGEAVDLATDTGNYRHRNKRSTRPRR